jgi:hypothetical protein
VVVFSVGVKDGVGQDRIGDGLEDGDVSPGSLAPGNAAADIGEFVVGGARLSDGVPGPHEAEIPLGSVSAELGARLGWSVAGTASASGSNQPGVATVEARLPFVIGVAPARFLRPLPDFFAPFAINPAAAIDGSALAVAGAGCTGVPGSADSGLAGPWFAVPCAACRAEANSPLPLDAEIAALAGEAAGGLEMRFEMASKFRFKGKPAGGVSLTGVDAFRMPAFGPPLPVARRRRNAFHSRESKIPPKRSRGHFAASQ